MKMKQWLVGLILAMSTLMGLAQNDPVGVSVAGTSVASNSYAVFPVYSGRIQVTYLALANDTLSTKVDFCNLGQPYISTSAGTTTNFNFANTGYLLSTNDLVLLRSIANGTYTMHTVYDATTTSVQTISSGLWGDFPSAPAAGDLLYKVTVTTSFYPASTNSTLSGTVWYGSAGYPTVIKAADATSNGVVTIPWATATIVNP
jgi:hypothetical protein